MHQQGVALLIVVFVELYNNKKKAFYFYSTINFAFLKC